MTRIKYAIGGIPLPEHEHLSLGPRHPTEAGVVSLSTKVSAGRVHDVDVQPGYLHRAAEKLFEVRDYRSLIMLADRHDWLASFSGELVVTMAIEGAMGLVPPPRATWLRTMLAEYARLHSHLCFLSHLADGDLAADLWGLVDRLRLGLLTWSGNRVHPMLNRVGGLAADLPEGWLETLGPLLDDVGRLADRLIAVLEGQTRLRGLAVADAEFCRGYALSGPVARAAGLELDRRRSGYLAYDEVFEATPLGAAGDAQARFETLVAELHTAVTMLRRLASAIPGGDFSTKLSRRLKVPEGEHAAEVEAPWGIAGVLLVSRGGQTPWRLALRTPTFANVSALSALTEGARVEEISDVVASLGWAIGDLDK